MKISKKKIADINRLSIAQDELQKCDDPKLVINGSFIEFPPDQWSQDQTALFDLVFEIETKLKNSIIAIIQGKDIPNS